MTFIVSYILDTFKRSNKKLGGVFWSANELLKSLISYTIGHLPMLSTSITHIFNNEFISTFGHNIPCSFVDNSHVGLNKIPNCFNLTLHNWISRDIHISFILLFTDLKALRHIIIVYRISNLWQIEINTKHRLGKIQYKINSSDFY